MGDLSLGTLKGGAAIELFDLELDKVMDNIQDPNTEPTEAREITLKVTIKPDEDRFLSAVGIQCWPSKLAKRRPAVTQVAMEIDRNGVVAAKEIIPAQRDLFEPNDGKVAPIRKES